MNTIEIQREEGFPVQKRTFDFLQDAFGSAIKLLCQRYGDNFILHGVKEDLGDGLSDGAVVINGELLPFEGTTYHDRDYGIVIRETAETVLYESGELLQTYFTRVARMELKGTIPLSSLRRIPQLRMPTEWVNCTQGNNITVVQTIQCRINENGKLQLRGRYFKNTSSDIINDFRLMIDPSEIMWFPPRFIRISAVEIENSENAMVNLYVRTDGFVWADFFDGQFGDGIIYNLNTEVEL